MITRLIALALVATLSTSPLTARTDNAAQAWRAVVASLAPGTLVEVRLVDGSRVKGTVLGTSSDDVTLMPRTRIPVPPRTIAIADIANLERKKAGMSPAIKVLLGTGIGVGAGMLILGLFAAAISD